MIVTIEGKFGGMTLDESTQIEDALKALGFPYSIAWEPDVENDSQVEIDSAISDKMSDVRKETKANFKAIRDELDAIERELA